MLFTCFVRGIKEYDKQTKEDNVMNKIEEIVEEKKAKCIKTRLEMMQNNPQLPDGVIASSEDFYIELNGDADDAYRKFIVLRQDGFEVEKYYDLTRAWDAMRAFQRNENYRTEAEANIND